MFDPAFFCILYVSLLVSTHELYFQNLMQTSVWIKFIECAVFCSIFNNLEHLSFVFGLFFPVQSNENV